MSVLIKDMKMPKNCVECKLYDLDSEQCPIYAIYKEDYSDKRFEKCPLVEVPTPHGRLIDADKLLEKQFEEEHTHDYIVYADDIDDAPTVIEAEDIKE